MTMTKERLDFLLNIIERERGLYGKSREAMTEIRQHFLGEYATVTLPTEQDLEKDAAEDTANA